MAMDGRKNCRVIGIRSRTEYRTRAPVFISGAEGAIIRLKSSTTARIRYWTSRMCHRLVRSILRVSRTSKDVCNLDTSSSLRAVGRAFWRARRRRLGRYLWGMGLRRAKLREPGQKGSFGLGCESRALNSCIVEVLLPRPRPG